MKQISKTLRKPISFTKRRSSQKLGEAPGTITYLGDKTTEKQFLNLFSYTQSSYRNEGLIVPNVSIKLNEKDHHYWLNVVGLNDSAFITSIGQNFGINNLSLEDIVDTAQRSKIDDFDHYIFGVFKMVYLNEAKEIKYEHVAMVLQDQSVIVFQEIEADVFDGVRTRLSQKESRIRARGSDYLFFALLDAIVDHYFIALDTIGEQLEILESEVYTHPNQGQGLAIQQLKKEILKLRQHIYPTKDLIQRLLDSEHPLISKETKVFLRDLLDHATEINESLQLYRELSINLMELYMSIMSNKMNEVMKVLTIMASIFIPLTFIAGIYGMNFDYMPELHWKYGYATVWIFMGACFLGMLLYFRTKKWL